MAEQPKKLHVAVFPWLAFGHIIPYFELSKLIAQKGHKISFISTPRNIQRLPKLPSNLQPLVDLIELPLPHVDKLPENSEATMDIPNHCVPYLKKAFDGLEQPLSRLLLKSSPDWIICDFAHHWLPPISSQLGIPCIFFIIFSAFGISFFADSFVSKDSFDETCPHKVSLQSFEDKIISDQLMEQSECGISDEFRIVQVLHGADFVAMRSCMEIEGESLKFIEKRFRRPVIPVGLLPPSLQFSEEDSKDDDNNWSTILHWLDRHDERSVIYVAFGSEVTLSNEEFTEVAMGLELSGFPYFRVLKKQNSPDGSLELQDWVENHPRKHGLVWSSWAPQMRILAHKSIGGFLTHCGWSSVIESLQVGCPLILLPFQNEQGLVARLMEEKGVGIRVVRNEEDGKFTRDSVAATLRSVMLEEEGKTCRRHAEEMSKIVGDRELHQKYIDNLVHHMEIHCPATSKH